MTQLEVKTPGDIKSCSVLLYYITIHLD